MSNKEVTDFYKAIENINYYYPTLLEMLAKKAEYQREHYNQLVKSGFSDKDALEIVKVQKVPWD